MLRSCQWLLGLTLSGSVLCSVDHYDVADGLSQNSVVAIAADERGFVWLGTEDGLNRFDGNQFRVYRADPLGDGLPDGFIQRLERAGDTLWIGTIGAGLARMQLREERLQGLRAHLPDVVPARASIQALASLSAQRVLTGTTEGVFEVDWPPADTATVRQLPLANELQGASVRALLLLRDSRVLVGTDRGACIYDPERQLCALIGASQLPANRVLALAEDRAGGLWLSVDQLGLVRLDGDARVAKIFAFDQALPAGVARILSIADRDDGGLWLGTDTGVYPWLADCHCVGARVDDEGLQAIDAHRKLIYALKTDSDGKLWIGSWNHGLDRYDPQRQAISRHQPQLIQAPARQTRAVRAFSADEQGLWLGTYGGGVLRATPDGPGYRYDQPAALQPESVAEGLIWSLLQHPEGQLWIGSDANLRIWHGAEQRLSAPIELAMDDRRQPLRSVRSLLRDRSGRVWVGGESGLARIDEPLLAQPLARLVVPEPPDRRVFALHQDWQGRIWVGTWSGVFGYTESGEQRLGELAAQAQLRVVWDIADGPDRALWIGTSNGLIRVDDDGQWRRYTEADGLANRVIYAIERDAQSLLWLSSNRGIMRFDPLSGRSVNFGLRDQLQHIEFMFGAHAQDQQGRLLFGGARGFNRIEPDQIALGDAPPLPQLTGVLVDGVEIEADNVRAEPAVAAPSLQALTLYPSDSVLELHYGAIAFDQPRELNFRYRLQGFDLRWQEAGKRRLASYTNLPPGQYEFQIEALSRFGQASLAPRTLRLTVLPHWYQTRWFQAALVVLALLLIAALVQWRVHQLQQRRRVLEKQVAERTLEIRTQRDALDQQRAELQRINAELAALSRRDSLTGLHNRRALLERLEQLRGEAAEGGGTLSAALIDLDHFKRVNDRYGHAIGDAALIHLARCWEAILPSDAVLGRYGGEEFLLLLPNCKLADGLRCCQTLCAALRQRPVAETDPPLLLRASVGVAELASASESIAHLLQRADAALYRAKDEGRDRVVGAG